MTPTRLLVVIAAVFAVVLAGAAGGNAFLAKYNRAVADARAARAAVAQAVQHATAAQHAADSAVAAAGAHTAAEHAAIARAAAAEHRATQLKSSFTALALSAPDTCRPVLATADSLIAAQDSTISELHVGIARADSAKADLAFALDTTRAALKDLRGAAVSLSHADAMLEKHSRPSFLLRILPKPGLGAQVGVDLNGKLHETLGVHLGWTF